MAIRLAILQVRGFLEGKTQQDQLVANTQSTLKAEGANVTSVPMVFETIPWENRGTTCTIVCVSVGASWRVQRS